MDNRQTVVIGFLGTQLDGGQGAGRWERWRPTVSLVQHEDLVVDRMELLHARQHLRLAELVKADIAAVSPETTVRLVPMDLGDPWDFGEVYGALYDWTRDYPFDPARERYWAHITTGTHVAQICLFLLVEARFLPGVLLQTSPPKRQRHGAPGDYTLIDLDLSRYDVLAQRFSQAQDDAVRFLKSGIATRNARFNALIDEIERVAVRSKAPVLLTGPTGAGKSHLARRMFELKRVAPPGQRRLRRGQLRDAAGRWCGLGAVRPPAGRIHRGGHRTRRPAAHGPRGRALSRRDRRAGAGRAGHAAQGGGG